MNKTISAALITTLTLFFGSPAVAEILSAAVTGGAVEGVLRDGVASFQGIPFAAAPVGTLRWKPPQSVRAWSGTRKAEHFALPCAQPTPPGQPSSEDCLYLNVWTAAASADERRPVMVWVHGGGFTYGATSTPTFDGAQLAREGVVLVSIAYRLGAFGFLAHPDLTQEGGNGSGAYGLQDQLAALRWVQANIAAFGGDPARVTLFGQSAGGMSASLLAASPRSRGLFQQVISQSSPGLFLPPRTNNEPPGAGQALALSFAEANGKRFLGELGARNIEAARQLPTETIIAVSTAHPSTFWPVVDGDVVPLSNYEAYRSGHFSNVPALIGLNSDDAAADVPRELTRNRYELLPKLVPCSSRAVPLVDSYAHETDAAAVRALHEVLRDIYYGWNAWTWATLQSSTHRSKTFVYYFDVRTETTPAGAVHSAEVPFVFGNFPRPPTSVEQQVSELMRNYWVQFARTGDPNIAGQPAWPAFDAAAPQALALAAATSAQPFPAIDKMPAIDAFAACMRNRAAHEGERKLLNRLVVGSGAAMLLFGVVRWRSTRQPMRRVATAVLLVALLALIITMAFRASV
jgi:para-nitrobenzyl esterase